MKEVLLVIILLILFGFGYILMKRLDVFLFENRKSIEKECEKVEPSQIMLTNDLSEQEILTEIRQFRKKHESAKIVIFDDMDEKDET